MGKDQVQSAPAAAPALSPMAAGLGIQIGDCANSVVSNGGVMDRQQAQRVLANEDYLPWAEVKQAKEVLGIVEQSAAEIWAEIQARRAAEEALDDFNYVGSRHHY